MTMFTSQSCDDVHLSTQRTRVSDIPLWSHRREFGRLWSCALVHMDLGHICSNVGSVLPELLAMEEILGSARMAVELGVMTGVAHGLYGA